MLNDAENMTLQQAISYCRKQMINCQYDFPNLSNAWKKRMNKLQDIVFHISGSESWS